MNISANRTILAAALSVFMAPALAQEVTVSGGKVAGLAMSDGSAIFYGIPYAAAPVGALRWKPPAPSAPWSGVLDGRKVAPACVQGDQGWNQAFMKGAQEDCLTLSIRTPALGAKKLLPVLVYIHGGANAAGAAGSLADDAIHREGIVLVKLQYRLAAFGFLGLDALRAEDPLQSHNLVGVSLHEIQDIACRGVCGCRHIGCDNPGRKVIAEEEGGVRDFAAFWG